MLTMKHIMRPNHGESAEYVRQIGSYLFKTKDDYVQFLAFDDKDGDGSPAVWSGWRTGDKFKNPVVGTIYIMNDVGATVANYRYVSDLDEMDALWPEPSSPPEPEKPE